jgi:hypothetical protein
MPVDHCRPLLFALAAVLLMACGNENQRSAQAVFRDSAGVGIIENTSHRWPEGSGWQLADEPSVDIGALDDDPRYQLFQVVGALRLSDGRLVVANSGTAELRFYDGSGTYLSSSGRKGGGPGEFGGLNWIGVSADDSILAYDWQNRRISVFDAHGRYARGFLLRDLSQAPPSHTHPALLGAGSLLVGTQRLFSAGPLTTGVYHDSVFYLVFDGEGVLADTVGRHAGTEFFVATLGEDIDLMPLPFGRSAHAAPWHGGFFFGDGASYEIAYYSRAGDLLRLVRRTHTPPQLTPTRIQRYIEAQLANVASDDERRFIESLFAEVPFPETMPAYRDLQVDALGNLWVEEYERPVDEKPRWTVFSPDGEMLGVVETPSRFTIYQIGPDFVLGRWTDDLDIEHIRLYELRRDPEPI